MCVFSVAASSLLLALLVLVNLSLATTQIVPN